MRRSPLWREFESGQGFLLRALRFLVLAGGIVVLAYAAALRLHWTQQLGLAALILVAALWINRSSKSQVATLTLVLLSVYSTVRYAYWRSTTAWSWFHDPGNLWSTVDVLFVCLLLLAELYAFAVLVLGYLQTAWPLRRSPVPLPEDPAEWPAVDLLIPTYDEPLDVVRFTALAAINIDWPVEKLNVYILDDGRREEFRRFAEEAGTGYITRPDNSYAKAGNVNHALEQLHSPFVAIFDCDHVPTRSFLQLTMGWLLRDQKLAVLQTPHHFYSPDPFERNLDQFRVIPNEDELYYGVIQDGNDFWNATCFCGSCAVLRRSALDEVGGLATETVTEDAHTSLRLQMQGWNTAYINIPQAAGLATERLSAHIRQRIRWARGMVQVLRRDNPLFARGLSAGQRLCYFNAMLHFLFALPRLIFLTAPLMYLLFGRTSIPGFWAAILVYAAPHILLSSITHSRIQGAHRYSFWNEIYETVLAPYILFPTLLAMISPRLGRFNVTRKGGVVVSGYFDARVARPFLLLLAFNAAGLLCAIARMVPFRTFTVPGWLAFVNWPEQLYTGHDLGIVCVNLAWLLFNTVILGVATAVAWESQQRRQTVRVAMEVPSDVVLPDGSMIQGVTCDLSGGGVRTRVQGQARAAVGDPVKFVFRLLDGTATLPARVVAVDGDELRAKFENLTMQEDEALTTLLYSRADSWLTWGAARQPDRPLRSLVRIFRLSLHGLGMTLGFGRGGAKSGPTKLVASVVPLLVVLVLGGLASRRVRAAQNETPVTQAPALDAVQPEGDEAPAVLSHKPPAEISGAAQGPAPVPGFARQISLKNEDGQALVLRGPGAVGSVSFRVARNERVNSATLNVRYRASPGVPSVLQVTMNGIPVGSIAVGQSGGADQNGFAEWQAKVPPEMIAAENQLRFDLQPNFGVPCNDPSAAGLWVQIDPASTLQVAGTGVQVTDLSALPLPFFDPAMRQSATVQVVMGQLSPKTLQAGGEIASWLGAQSAAPGLRFAVSSATIPAGNAVVIADGSVLLPPGLQADAADGPIVALRPNPNDPSSAVLLISGRNPDELLTAASVLASSNGAWQGSTMQIHDFHLPPERAQDDAPRWLGTDRVPIGDIAGGGRLETDGSEPLRFRFRVPPDLDYGDRRNLALHMDYRYNGVPLAAGSTLQVGVNGSYVSSAPLPHTDSASPVLETVVPVPVVDMQPFRNMISFDFRFRADPAAACGSGVDSNLTGAILKDSYLDLSGIAHSATMPNLQLFADAGYPFTRRADLADTAVVVPDRVTPPEIELLLTLFAHFGEATGYPALRVRVTSPNGIQHDSAKNYVLLGTAADQSLWSAFKERLPALWDSTGLHAAGTTAGRFPWLHLGKDASERASGFTDIGGNPDAVVEEFEWPKGSRRTAVAIMLRDDSSARGFASGLIAAAGSGRVNKDVSVLNGSRFASYRIGRDEYRVGDDSALFRVSTTLKVFPWLIAALTVLFCFLIAVLLQAMLRRSARLRLRGVE